MSCDLSCLQFHRPCHPRIVSSLYLLYSLRTSSIIEDIDLTVLSLLALTMASTSTPIPRTPSKKRRRRNSDHLFPLWEEPVTPTPPPKIDYHPRSRLLNNHKYRATPLSFAGHRPNGTGPHNYTSSNGPSPRLQPTNDAPNNPFFESVFDDDPPPSRQPDAYAALLQDLDHMGEDGANQS